MYTLNITIVDVLFFLTCVPFVSACCRAKQTELILTESDKQTERKKQRQSIEAKCENGDEMKRRWH